MAKHWFRVVLSGLLIMVSLFALAGQAVADDRDGKQDVKARKIVVFREDVKRDVDKEEIVGRAGAAKVKHLRLINATVVEASRAGEEELKRRPDVLRVDEDAVAYTQAEVLPWGVNRIDADLVWDKNHDMVVDAGANAGAGVKVAVIDTGIDLSHPDLKANIKGGVNTIQSWKTANDDNGHGSHVAGIIAAVDNTTGVMGVAPKAYLYAVKVLSASGSGYVSDIIEGIQWSIANGMQVINMSLGTSSDIPSLHDAVIAANNTGIVVVAAAGNSGPGDNTVLYPAKYPEVIAVSAIDSNSVIASWSSRGAQVELAAPGVSIYSTYRKGGYRTLSGTSMASPHVAGVAALVIASGISDSNGNGAINDEVRAKLQSTADDLGTSGRDSLYGYGRVDAEEAATGVQTAP